MQRRHLVFALAALPLAAAAAPTAVTADFAALEAGLDGELGVAAIDTATGRTVGHRQDQRFPMCSTFKVVLAAAVLARAAREPGLLDRRLPLPKSVFVDWSPITGKHVDGDMSVAQLCAATLQYSDNNAGNVLLREDRHRQLRQRQRYRGGLPTGEGADRAGHLHPAVGKKRQGAQ